MTIRANKTNKEIARPTISFDNPVYDTRDNNDKLYEFVDSTDESDEIDEYNKSKTAYLPDMNLSSTNTDF